LALADAIEGRFPTRCIIDAVEAPWEPRHKARTFPRKEKTKAKTPSSGDCVNRLAQIPLPQSQQAAAVLSDENAACKRGNVLRKEAEDGK
jgi:hypothetical protein